MAKQPVTTDEVLAAVAPLPPEARARALRATLASLQRRRNKLAHPTPGDLATALSRDVRQTPALRLIDKALAEAVETGGRLIITIPPQEGKSSRVAVWLPIWALVRNPDTRIVSASYAESLAKRNSRTARDIVAAHGTGGVDAVTGLPIPDRLGIRVADGYSSAVAWSVEGYEGSYYATGIGGSLTGRSADLMIIDDPVKNMVEADSAREREKVWDWWTSVAVTRLAPGAAVVLIMTRWHEDDLAGRLIAQEQKLPPEHRRLKVMNIPAIAAEGVPDALNRPPGEPLVSARGRTPDDFFRTRDSVGSRTWAALYQGQPTPSEGGLFQRSDFQRHRTTDPELVGRIVTVDPAESGHGDEAGLLGMGWDADGRIYVTDDLSRQMRSEAWAREAILLALRTGAGDLLYEAFTARETYASVLHRAWEDLAEAVKLYRAEGSDRERAARAYVAAGHTGDPVAAMRDAEAAAPFMTSMDTPPYRVVPWRAPGDKVARAAGARQGVETGRLRMAGTFPLLEQQAAAWQPGQGSPDRVDAMVNGYEHISSLIGATGFDIASPFG